MISRQFIVSRKMAYGCLIGMCLLEPCFAGTQSGSGANAAAESGTSASYKAELLRISPKRTVLTVDFRGGASVAPGATVKVTFSNGAIQGKVRKIVPSGRSILRLKSALPTGVEIGSVDIEVMDAGPESERVNVAAASSAGSWRDESILTGSSGSGFSGSAEFALAPLSGKTNVSGGSANEKLDFGESSLETGLDARAEYAAGAFGGGVNLNYLISSANSKSSVNTTSTASKDSDSIEEKLSGYRLVPSASFKTAAFAAALGLDLRRFTNERSVKIAGVEAPSEPVKSSESGILLEFAAPMAGMKFGFTTLLAGKGTLKETGQEDVERRRMGFGINWEYGLAGLTHRLGFDLDKFTDKYSSADLVNTSMGLDWQTQVVMWSLNLVPRVAYDWSKIDFGARKGRESELAFGSRILFGAPYASFEIKYKSREQSAYATSPEYKTSLFGAGLAAGTTF
jgi:hypothetical protein